MTVFEELHCDHALVFGHFYQIIEFGQFMCDFTKTVVGLHCFK